MKRVEIVVVTGLLIAAAVALHPGSRSRSGADGGNADSDPKLPAVGGLARPSKSPPPLNLAPVAAPDLPKTQLLRSLVTSIEGVHSSLDPAQQMERLNRAAQEVALADLPAVVEFLWYKPHLSPAGGELRNLLVRRWTELEPESAARWIASRPDDGKRQDALQQVASVWATTDFAGAVSWAKALPGDVTQTEMLAQFAYEAARTEPLEAMRLAVELPGGVTRDDLLVHVAGTWAAAEPQSAAEWARQVGDEDLRNRLLASVATVWGQESPREAAQLALDSLPAGRQQDDAVIGIVQSWTQTDSLAVAGWVERFPTGRLRDRAVENLIWLWADQDLTQAQGWVDGLPAGAVRDVAIGAMVGKVLPNAPDSAAALAIEIGDADRRLQELENVGSFWLEQDQAAATRWINSVPLPADSRARLLAANPAPEANLP